MTALRTAGMTRERFWALEERLFYLYDYLHARNAPEEVVEAAERAMDLATVEGGAPPVLSNKTTRTLETVFQHET